MKTIKLLPNSCISTISTALGKKTPSVVFLERNFGSHGRIQKANYREEKRKGLEESS